MFTEGILLSSAGTEQSWECEMYILQISRRATKMGTRHKIWIGRKLV